LRFNIFNLVSFKPKLTDLSLRLPTIFKGHGIAIGSAARGEIGCRVSTWRVFLE
jgi:hypothetical protein